MYFTTQQLQQLKNHVKTPNLELEEKLTNANQNTFWFEHELRELGIYIPKYLQELVENKIEKMRSFASHCEAIEREELAMM